jgi:glycerol-3-phosphate dehydrogenase
MLTNPLATLKNCYDEFKMVLGCARERRYMAEKNAHLTNWIPIALPFDKWVIWPPPMGAWAFAFMPIACRLNAIRWLYDSLAGFSCPTAYIMSRSQTLQKFPQLTERDIKFCAVLHEVQHNDARTNLAIALSAAAYGADITNYTEVVQMTKDESGAVTGASVKDLLTGDTFQINAKSVVIAGGPYTDEIRKMEVDDGDLKPAVQGGPGVHIVLPGYMCPSDIGLLDYNTTDGRFFSSYRGRAQRLSVQLTRKVLQPLHTIPRRTRSNGF